MSISTILAIFLLAYNSTASFQNFIAIQENKNFVKLAEHNETTMNRSRNFVYSSSFTTAQGSSSTQQTTGVSISSDALKSPHILSIKSKENAQLIGEVAVDGVVIKKLQGSQSFNLSPYLKLGVNKVEISGNYKPASSSVSIEFSGANTQVTQQMSGNGTLSQTLIVTVR